MAIALDSWIAAQRAQIVTNWQQWGTPPAVAIEHMDVLGASYGGHEGRNSGWAGLRSIPGAEAMVQQTGPLASLWVNPASDRYPEYFRLFLREQGVDASALTGAYDVDHLYNRERAINFGYRLVRLFPVKPTPNRSHGAGYEKAMTQADIGRSAKVMKLMDEVSAMKFFGLRSPSIRAAPTPEQLAHMHIMASLFGLSVAQIQQGVTNLMARAHRRR